MWWLTLPVLIYSAGLMILWLVQVYHGRSATHVRADSGSRQAPDASCMSGAVSTAAEHDTAGTVRVSVIVAARNEENQITHLLESLVRQDYPDNLYEIIIVNDNSTDRTPVAVSEFIDGFINQSCPRIRLIYNPFTGKKRAVRYGIEKASGDVILTTDADCIVGSGWVRSHVSWYTEGGLSMVLAPVIERPAGGFWSHFGVFEFSALQAVTGAAAVAGFPVMCNAANMSIRREVYLRHAGELRDDLSSGDDMFLLEAVMRGGGAVRHDGRITAAVETAGAVTAAALVRQRARWASKAVHLRGTPVITLAAATAACNTAVTAAAVTACFSLTYLPVVAAMYGIKAIPDYLLINGEMKKRGHRMQMILFIVSELVYPFYFMVVWVMSMLPASRRFAGK